MEVEDFSGGVTDYYLNAPANKMRFCDNLLLVQYLGAAKPFTRPGSRLYSTDDPQIPAGAQRISTSFFHFGNFLVQSSKKLYWFDTSGPAWSTVSGPTGNDAFDGSDTTKIFTYSQWNYHVLIAHSGRNYPQKIIKNSSGAPEIMEAGLPKVDSSGITITPAAGANNWLYTFVYKQTYTTFDNITFTDRGTPSAIRSTTGATTVAITTIPVLSNGATGNFRTATIEVEIYRTINNGTTFYFVGSVTNGTTSFNDNVSDATLQGNALLYTTGGTVAADRPPKCKLVHVFGDIGYYANIQDVSGQALVYRLQQSTPGDIDSAPATFFVDVDDEIVGMSSTKSNLVLACRNSAYRVDGAFDAVGRGGMRTEKISDTASCVSAQSVVQTLDGVFWAGFDGIYYSDGFKVLKLNGDYDQTYKTFVYHATAATMQTKQDRIQGKYDKHKNRVWWTIQKTSNDDVDICYVLDLNYGIKPNACFYTCSGLDSFSPTAIEFDGTDLIRSDRRGFVFRHNSSYFSDPKIDLALSPEDWAFQTIFYTLESIQYPFGTASLRKYITAMTVTCLSTTNLSLQIVSNNDDDHSVANLKPIRNRSNVVWGDPDVYWGDPALEWNIAGLVNERRRMPAMNLRCNYKSLRFQNAYVVLFTSELLGTADIDATLKTVTLTNAAISWPTNAVDWYISFEADGYVREYLIISRTDTTLVYSDAGGISATAAGSKWTIRGYPKDEILNLISYSVPYNVFSPTQDVFNTSDSGEIGSGDS